MKKWLIALFVVFAIVLIGCKLEDESEDGNTSTSGGSEEPVAQWSTETLDSVGNTGLLTRLAVDATDKVHIVYFDETNKAVRYTTNNTGSWTIETVSERSLTQVGPAIGLDSENKVHIMYIDRENKELRYAKNTTGSWSIETIIRNANVVDVNYLGGSIDPGYLGEFVFDQDGKLHVAAGFMEGLVYITDGFDSNYSGLDPDDVAVTNVESVGFIIGSLSGNTSESGTEATFSVRLDNKPSADVIIGVSSSNTAEGTVEPSSITLTVDNWNIDQIVTVSGVDDFIEDGDKDYNIVIDAATSDDPEYNNIDPEDITATNMDNEAANIIVSSISGKTTEYGIYSTFSVKLDSQPSADVSIGVSSADVTEGTVSTNTLIFDSGNWDNEQTVTVTGIDDASSDGDISYDIVLAEAISTDPVYNTTNPDDVTVVNVDDETAAFRISPVSNNTSENGTIATFTVVLNKLPTADVAIAVSSSNTAEGTVDPSSLTFNSNNGNSAQTVTVTGVNDALKDGNINYSIILATAISEDTDYNGIDPDDVSAINIDNETVGFVVSAINGDTTEKGAASTFTVKLTNQPNANVSIGISSSDTTEGTVSPANVTFTTENWNTEQTVEVTGMDDSIDDGNQTYSIVLAAANSSDSSYNELDPDDVVATNIDDDTAGFSVGPISGMTSETLETASFEVKLNTLPTADVIIGISSSDLTEGTIETSSLTFTPSNWNTNQTIVVTGVDDEAVDANQTYSIDLAAASSNDSNYDALDPDNVSIINIDDETAGFIVSSISGYTSENGKTATFTIKLSSKPKTAEVAITVSSSDTAEGTVNPSNLLFTPDNWDTAQIVTVTGMADDENDSDQNYTILLGAATASKWTREVISSANKKPSIAIDSNNKLHIAAGKLTDVFWNTYSIIYLNNSTGTWEEIFNDRVAAHADIGLDSNDVVYISNGGGGGNNFLYVYTSENMEHERIDYCDLLPSLHNTYCLDDSYTDGVDNSIAIDDSHKAHISFSGGSYIYYGRVYNAHPHPNDLYYLYGSPSNWSMELVEQGVSGEGGRIHSSIGIDSAGKIYISYYDQEHGDLKLATK